MNVISLLTPKDVDEIGGLTPESVCGKFEGDDSLPEYFRVNPVFVDFMHSFIEKRGIELPSLTNAAEQQKAGYLYIIDFRTPEGIMGNVPSEDIIGAFQVQDRTVVEDSYWRNEAHRIYTENGLVKLPNDLHDLLVNELKKLC